MTNNNQDLPNSSHRPGGNRSPIVFQGAVAWDPPTEILEAFDAALKAEPERKGVLAEWIARYPDYSDELTEWAVAFHSGELDAYDAPAESGGEVSGYAAGLIAALIAEPLPASSVPKSLIAAAKEAGLNVGQLAARIRVDRTVLRKLENRLLSTATVPQILIDALADALNRSAGQIRAYLALPPQLASGAQYRAATAPVLEGVTQQSFADALMSAAEISAEDRAYWLAQIERTAE